MRSRIGKAAILLIPLAYSVYRAGSVSWHWGTAGLFALLFILACVLKNAKTVFWGSLGISFIFLDWTFKGIDTSHIGGIVVLTRWHMMAGFVALVVTSQIIRCWKWQILLSAVKKVRIGRLFTTLMIGFWANSVFPGKSGELIRIYLLGVREGIKKTSVLATVVLDRMFDGLITLVLFIAAFFMLQRSVASLRSAIITSSVLYGMIVVGLFVVYYRVDLFKKILDAVIGRRFPGLAGRLTALLDSFHGGLHVLRNARQLALVTALSIGMWIIALVGYAMAVSSLNIQALVPDTRVPGLIVATVVLAVSINLSAPIPAAPGGAGPYHAFILFGLGLLNPLIATPGTPEHTQVAVFSLLLWVVQTGNLVILGLISLYRENISIGNIRRRMLGGEKTEQDTA